MNAIAGFLSDRDIRLDLEVADKRQLFEAIGRHVEQEHALPQDWVVRSLARREQAGSTGLGLGVAIPHARVSGLDRVLALYMRLRSPIPFDAPDHQPVRDVLVLLVPQPATDEHLVILAEAAQIFSYGCFRERLHGSATRQEVMQLFSAGPEA